MPLAARVRVCGTVLLLAALLSGACLTAAVDSLTVGLVGYLPCDGDLRVITPAGEESEAGLARASQAYADDLQAVPANEPRFVPGRFDRGILIEPGYESEARYESRNWLAPEAAQVMPRSGVPLAFQSVAEASVSIIQAAEGEPNGLQEPILEGRASLHVTCGRAGGGAETRVPVAVLGGRYTASVFVRGEQGSPAEDRVRLEILEAGAGTVLGTAEHPVTTAWRRIAVNADVGTFTRDLARQTYTPVLIRVTAPRAGQVVILDAFVLEMCGGYSYAGMGSPSSWLPGLAFRASEVLDLDDLRPCLAGQTGTVALWLRLRGTAQARRTLFELASANRWQPHLQLALLADTRLDLGRRTEKPETVTTEVRWEPDSWHHVAVSWTADQATVYLDGVKVGEISGLQIPLRPAAIHLASGGPNAAANAVLDDAFLYHRVLTDAEVGRLAHASSPGGGLAFPEVTLRPERFVETVAHGLQPQPWRCELRNRGATGLQDVDVTLRLGNALALTRRLAVLPPGHAGPVEFSFLADLAVGTYPLTVVAVAGGSDLVRFSRRVDITPAPEPPGNLQVLPWGRTFDRSFGFTCGGGDLAETMRQGLAWAPHHRYLGWPRTIDGEDLVHDLNGKPGMTRLSSPAMAQQMQREAARYARRMAGAPALRAVTFNTEAQWIWSHDFTPENVAWVRKTFHLDLDAWRNPPKGEVDAHQLPFGRLRPAVAGLELPANRVLDPATSFYAYHRWFHGPSAPTESLMNQTLSDALLARRPDVLTIQEPILRRPAVRAFERMGIAQEWFYYEEPMRAVMVQEGLNAAVRGTGMRASGMPQFLFKAGGAAPYNAVPTADLFREAAWLCALQPIRVLTYWNFEVVPSASFENPYHRCLTKDQLDALFGTPVPTWEEAKRVLESKPDVARKLFPWTPELVTAFREFHRDAVGPLGTLIAEWRNRPRRLAIVRSFASQLYGDVRWPGTTWLENSAVHCGVPFDLILDEDVEGGGDALSGYQMVVVSAAACLTQPMIAALARCSERGGSVVTDAETRVTIPGALVLRATDAPAASSRRLDAAEGDLKTVGGVADPQYVEAMARLAESGALQGLAEPAFLDILDRRLTPEARSLSPFTWLNLLEAEGACYLGVVNDLRVHGPLYGHFGAVRETGVPQSALVSLAASLGSVAYDLVTHEPVALTASGSTLTADLDLAAGGGRVVVLLPAPIGRLDLQAQLVPAAWGDHHGRQIAVHATLLDVENRIVPGLIPATLALVHPDGSRSDFSHHTAFRRGVLDAALPVLANGPVGVWRVQVQERADGRTGEVLVPIR